MRERLLYSLPVSREHLLVRSCERSDMNLLAAWPRYPFPHDTFTFSFAQLPAAEMDALFNHRRNQTNRITLVADHGAARCIGYLALLEIDWESGQSRNLGVRFHPEWCGKRLGQAMLAVVRDWWFAGGMKGLRLDVASCNLRAVRCYERVGFVRCGEFWKEDSDLAGANLSDPQWQFLEGHVRVKGQARESRFLAMELPAQVHR